jgi:hypothetical protein
MTSFAGCDLPYLATTMEYAGGPESTTFIGFIVLLTLPVSAGIARQMGQGGHPSNQIGSSGAIYQSREGR